MTTAQQHERATAFREMHQPGQIAQIVNAWDATSARIAVAAGARAIGTTSFGVAVDHGVSDGEHLAFGVVLDVVAQIVEAVDVPVTMDLEAGRGAAPAAVAESVAAALARGVVGANIEDSIPGQPGALFDRAVQGERLAAARRAADDAGVPLFVNARCDVYFGAELDPEARLPEVLARAQRYRDAGSDGLFLPGLADIETIAAITDAIDLPLNVMAAPGMPDLDQLKTAGVRRISQGASGFLLLAGAMKSLTEQFLRGEVSPPIDQFGAGLSVLPALVQ